MANSTIPLVRRLAASGRETFEATDSSYPSGHVTDRLPEQAPGERTKSQGRGTPEATARMSEAVKKQTMDVPGDVAETVARHPIKKPP